MNGGLLVIGEVDRSLDWVVAEGPLAAMLAAASPRPDARFATVRSRDGQFRATIPLDDLRRGHLHGGRLVIPDAPTRCWNVKDVASIEVTVAEQPDSVAARQALAPAPGR